MQSQHKFLQTLLGALTCLGFGLYSPSLHSCPDWASEFYTCDGPTLTFVENGEVVTMNLNSQNHPIFLDYVEVTASRPEAGAFLELFSNGIATTNWDMQIYLNHSPGQSTCLTTGACGWEPEECTGTPTQCGDNACDTTLWNKKCGGELPPADLVAWLTASNAPQDFIDNAVALGFSLCSAGLGSSCGTCASKLCRDAPPWVVAASQGDQGSCGTNGTVYNEEFNLCCPSSCGVCGGKGCGAYNGIYDECCTLNVDTEQPFCNSDLSNLPCYMPDITDGCGGEGTLYNSENGFGDFGLCCSANCSQCGGAGCGEASDGDDTCCRANADLNSDGFPNSGEICNDSLTNLPCFALEPTDDDGNATPTYPVANLEDCQNNNATIYSSTNGFGDYGLCCSSDCSQCGGTSCGSAGQGCCRANADLDSNDQANGQEFCNTDLSNLPCFVSMEPTDPEDPEVPVLSDLVPWVPCPVTATSCTFEYLPEGTSINGIHSVKCTNEGSVSTPEWRCKGVKANGNLSDYHIGELAMDHCFFDYYNVPAWKSFITWAGFLEGCQISALSCNQEYLFNPRVCDSNCEAPFSGAEYERYDSADYPAGWIAAGPGIECPVGFEFLCTPGIPMGNYNYPWGWQGMDFNVWESELAGVNLSGPAGNWHFISYGTDFCLGKCGEGELPFPRGTAYSGSEYCEAGEDCYYAQSCMPEELCGACLGDVNWDFDVNILDIVGMVNGILGDDLSNSICWPASDINIDGTTNILDIVSFASKIAGNGDPETLGCPAGFSQQGMWLLTND